MRNRRKNEKPSFSKKLGFYVSSLYMANSVITLYFQFVICNSHMFTKFSIKASIGYITLNRSKSLNALNRQLKAELVALLDQIAADDNIRAIIITGGGRAFCAGSDIKELYQIEVVEAEELI